MNWTNLTLEDMVESGGSVTQASVVRATRSVHRPPETSYMPTNNTNESHTRHDASMTFSDNNANHVVTSENSEILDPMLPSNQPTEPPNVAPGGGFNGRPRPRNLYPDPGPPNIVAPMPMVDDSMNTNYIVNRTKISLPNNKFSAPPQNICVTGAFSRNKYTLIPGSLFGDMTLLPMCSLSEGATTLLYDIVHPIVALSITIGVKTTEAPRSWLKVFKWWLETFTVAGAGSLKKGGDLKHLHIQGTAVVHMPTTPIAKTRLELHFKQMFDMWTNKNYHLCIRFCNDKKGHCFMYMLGYIQKQWNTGWYELVLFNLTREMLRAGIAARIRVDHKNKDEREVIYPKEYFKSVENMITNDLEGLEDLDIMRCITWLLQEGTHVLDTSFICQNGPYRVHREESICDRANVLLNMRMDPSTVTRAKVNHVITGAWPQCPYYFDNDGSATGLNDIPDYGGNEDTWGKFTFDEACRAAKRVRRKRKLNPNSGARRARTMPLPDDVTSSDESELTDVEGNAEAPQFSEQGDASRVRCVFLLAPVSLARFPISLAPNILTYLVT